MLLFIHGMDEPPNLGPNAPPELPVTARTRIGLSAGDVIGDRFKIVTRIGSGGTAVVYACTDLDLRAPAAVKVLTVHGVHREDARRRFLDEGRILANLRSPHLVQVLAVGEIDPETPFMALELLPGRSLEQRLRQEGPLPWREVAELLGQVAGALADMHQVDVIHRDIKPANLVEFGSATGRRLVKVIDLGIAKVHDWIRVDNTGLTPSPRHQTEMGLVVGTPGFLPPEVYLVPANPRFDTFALGVTLYELCTGVMPKIDDLRPMNETCPTCGAPPELEALVASALALIPEERIATAEEFGRRLEAIRIAHTAELAPHLIAGCFELLEPLGVGAKGEVFRAYHCDAPCYVALKLLSERSMENPEERARFAREARVLRAVRHPALPELIECRTSTSGRPYIAMSLVPGKRAGEFCIAKNLLPVAEVIDVGKSLSGALIALHARGVLHRDLHAANVMIDRAAKTTTAMLIDLGMAELEDKFWMVVDQRYPTRPAERVKLGTGGLERMDWTAPEARAGRGWTGRSDVWSLGLLLHRLLTGKRPATNAAGVLLSPREMQPRCTQALASALLSALNPDPDERVDAAELLELLELAADELAEETRDAAASPKPATSKPVTPPLIISRTPRTWAWAAIAALVLFGVVLRGANPEEPVVVQTIAEVHEVRQPDEDPPRAAAKESVPAQVAAEPVRPTMEEALNAAAPGLRICSKLAGGHLLVAFATDPTREDFANVAVRDASEAVHRCVHDTTSKLRFVPQAHTKFTKEYSQ